LRAGAIRSARAHTAFIGARTFLSASALRCDQNEEADKNVRAPKWRRSQVFDKGEKRPIRSSLPEYHCGFLAVLTALDGLGFSWKR